ncbi:MAG TPA: S41 family peptidase [Chitinophagaceae bacterium]|nr:S41 family peptidase [Chitinophagaceae bacterium]
MNMKFTSILWLPLVCLMLVLGSCSGSLLAPAKSRSSFAPLQKYSPEQLKQDFDLMKEVMEKFHPSVYWYTPKDSMEKIFSFYRSAITDSMTEQQYGFKILAPVITSVRCGHTSFNYSKKYSKAMQGIRLPSFPLSVKVWGDSMMVTGNLNKKDSVIKRGMLLNSIDGFSVQEITSIMFRYLPTDGYAENINYIRLSNSFPYYHRNIFGLKKNYSVNFTDSTGISRTIDIPLFDPMADTMKRIKPEKKTKPEKRSKQDRLNDQRSFRINNETSSAIMELNTFDGGAGLEKFFKRSFKSIHKNGIENLVIDIRNNGGGRVNYYAKLARYIRKTPFKVADTAYALKKGFGKYGKYFSTRTLNSFALGLFTSKRTDGLRHFNYWENHTFKPKKKYFFDGRVYVLIGGPTFSASTLFAQTVKGQDNIKLIGEETGGGSHGNNGLMIPYITLPNTGMRVRMPLFRVIQYNHPPKTGRGVTPDIYVPPTSKAVLNFTDLKMQKAFELISEEKQRTAKKLAN